MIFGFGMTFWFAQRDGLKLAEFLDKAAVVLKERHPEMDVDHELEGYRRIPAAHEASMGDLLRSIGQGNQGTF